MADPNPPAPPVRSTRIPFTAPWYLSKAPVAALIAIPTVLVAKATFGSDMIFGSDVLDTFYFNRQYAGQELAAGRLPVWDPHTMAGFPLLAAMQVAIFYPLNWPIVALPSGAFWTLTVWSHLVLAGLFCYAWLRRGLRLSPWGALVGSLVFQLSGYILAHVYAGHMSYVSSYPWLPAVLWRLERFLARPTWKRWALIALCVGGLLLAGFPMFGLFAAMVCGARLAFEAGAGTTPAGGRAARSGLAAAAGLAGVLLAAPQLLPALALVPQTHRLELGSYVFATDFSVPPENLVTLVAPAALGDVVGGAYWGRWYLWEVCGYVGVASILLSAVAFSGSHPQRFLWLGIGIAGLILALGRYTPIYRVVYSVVPGVSFFRAPGRYLYLFTVAAASLAGMGFDRLFTGERPVKRAALTGGIGAACVLLVVAALFGLVASRSRAWARSVGAVDRARLESLDRHDRMAVTPKDEAERDRRTAASLAWACGDLAALAAIFLLMGSGVLGRRAGAVAAASILVVELLAFGGRYFVGAGTSHLPWPPDLVRELRSRVGETYRIASTGPDSKADFGRCQISGLDHVGGYDPMALGRYVELINVADGRAPDDCAVFLSPSKPHAIYRMLGVKLWLHPAPGWTPSGSMGERPPLGIFEDPEALPRAFVVGRAVTIPDRAERLNFLATGPFRPEGTVVLEEEGTPHAAGESSPAGEAKVRAATPGSYDLDVRAPRGGYLVLTEAYYPGWSAVVDGTPVKIFRANHLVQAIEVPPGDHRVEFRYRERRLLAGLLLALATAVAAGGAWAFSTGRRARGAVAAAGESPTGDENA